MVFLKQKNNVNLGKHQYLTLISTTLILLLLCYENQDEDIATNLLLYVVLARSKMRNRRHLN